jgi:hypothetical protein
MWTWPNPCVNLRTRPGIDPQIHSSGTHPIPYLVASVMTQVARPDQAMVTARFTTDSQGFFRRRLPPSSPASFSIVSSSYPSLLCLCVPSPLASTQPIPLYLLRRTGTSTHQVADAHLPGCRCSPAWKRGEPRTSCPTWHSPYIGPASTRSICWILARTVQLVRVFDSWFYEEL